MRLLQCLAVIFLAIASVASQDQAKDEALSAVEHHPSDKRALRETILLDQTGLHTDMIHYRRPSFVPNRRRSTRPRQRPYPKSKRRPPKSKYPPKKARRYANKPKNHNRFNKPKHTMARRPVRPSFHKYTKESRVPLFIKHKPEVPFTPQEPVGFGEPPADHFEVNNPKQSYGEPPVDSYGNDISYKFKLHRKPPNYSYNPESFPANHLHGRSPESFQHLPPHDYDSLPSNHEEKLADFSMENEKVFPKSPLRETSHTEYNDGIRYPSLTYGQDDPFKNPRKNYHPHFDLRMRGHKKDHEQIPDKMIVGGQYAEPPARYIPRYKNRQHEETENKIFHPSRDDLSDSEESASNIHSSYVNYKNSNMAFSPQNLNDAFSVTNF